ncbi:MAG: RNA methyltransferase [Chloroflexota bacterium]|nr:RNA methyltransferase [Chloroflexota bacterium]
MNQPVITSKSNPRVKAIRALRHRKEREATSLFFVEGIRIVTEAVELEVPIIEYVVAPELLTSRRGQETDAKLQARHIPRLEVSVEVFQTLSVKEGPRGIGAVVRQRWMQLEDVRLETGIGWVALDAPQDPGNVGTILRTCDAVGAAGVMLLDQATDPYDPTALRASMGAIFSRHLVRAEFPQFLSWTREHGYPLVGTSDAAETLYDCTDYRLPLILLMGNEQHGLSPDQQAACGLMVRIPMAGRSDSLNLAVANGVMLYELLRRERRRGIEQPAVDERRGPVL